MIMMCQRWLVKCTPPPVVVLTTREAVQVWGQGVRGKSLYPPLAFAVNLKLP